jgi:hypothetical protein
LLAAVLTRQSFLKPLLGITDFYCLCLSILLGFLNNTTGIRCNVLSLIPPRRKPP